MDADACRVATYRSADPLDIPHQVLDMLPRFDGRPTRDVLDELQKEGMEVEPELIRRLVDFRILVDAE
jgi:hypothetical protein